VAHTFTSHRQEDDTTWLRDIRGNQMIDEVDVAGIPPSAYASDQTCVTVHYNSLFELETETYRANRKTIDPQRLVH
jgi:hypothetical protein